MTDSDQNRVVELSARDAIVLAGPGCGKTHILARRVYHALLMRGMAAERMLCLTFTNRAAREMCARVEDYMGSMPGGLFVGNLHRFCLRFLIANSLLEPDTAVVDDEDMAIFVRESFPDEWRRHPDIIRKNSMRLSMHEQGLDELMRHQGSVDAITDTEREDVATYRRFKADNNLIDYDDILLLTYSALCSKRTSLVAMNDYRWIQIDEVQDLSSLQMAIVDLLKAPDAETLYLGDEQQSIYGFAGAGIQVLDSIKRRCKGHIYSLRRNYRSPGQLVDFCNAYAMQYLDISADSLPASVQGNADGHCLLLAQTPTPMMAHLEGALAARYLRHADQTVAILTRTNQEARRVSATLTKQGLAHILVSQNDLFKGAAFKTVWSHLEVCRNPGCSGPWARLMYQTRSVPSLTDARMLVRMLSEAGMSPSALLDMDAPTELERFVETVDREDCIVAVLDTETTGLDTDSDDVIQISVIKTIGGQAIPGSRFSVFIESGKPVPEYLGSKPNPLFQLYRDAEKMPRVEGLLSLALYLSDCGAVCGHNVDFDLAILRSNFEQVGLEVPGIMQAAHSGIDTLRISRLLYPRLTSHTLEYMIGYLGLDGTNSHNADDDTAATAELLGALLPTARERLPRIAQIRANRSFRRAGLRLSQTYGPLYALTHKALLAEDVAPEYDMAAAFADAYSFFLRNGFIMPIGHIDYLLTMIRTDICDSTGEPRLRQQLDNHLYELPSYNEGDLFARNAMKERLVVMTIHKAKGMEMDNVIVHNAGQRFGNLEESMRVFYVAISRARRSLCLVFGTDPSTTIGLLSAHFHELSRTDQMSLMRTQPR